MNQSNKKTRAIIMADGKGTRWKSSFSKKIRSTITNTQIFQKSILLWPSIFKQFTKNRIEKSIIDKKREKASHHKHLIKIDGENLLERQVRLLKENGIHDVYITSHNKLCEVDSAVRYEPKKNEYEIDKAFSSKEIWNKNGNTLYLCGDVFFTEEAMKIICQGSEKDYIFFGRSEKNLITGKDCAEIFAFMFKQKMQKKMKNHMLFLKKEFQRGKLERCKLWELYRSLNNIPLNKQEITNNFTEINDFTDDFDTKEEFKTWYSFYKKDR
jgi:hypothetical protein